MSNGSFKHTVLLKSVVESMYRAEVVVTPTVNFESNKTAVTTVTVGKTLFPIYKQNNVKCKINNNNK